jgi:hypothetical protein
LGLAGGSCVGLGAVRSGVGPSARVEGSEGRSGGKDGVGFSSLFHVITLMLIGLVIAVVGLVIA